METPNGSVVVELFELVLTRRKDDRFGRVVITKSLTEDDLINIAVSRRTDLNASTLKSSISILREVAKEEVINGASVQLGLSYYQLGVDGVFIGNNAQWDDTKHSLTLKSVPLAEYRKILKKVTVHVRGMANSATSINTVTDVATQLINSTLTPGGGIKVSGKRVKIAGQKDGVGIWFINQTTKEETSIPMSSVIINNPSNLTFVAPANLPVGDYKLCIGTQYSNSKVLLKEVRTYVFDIILTVLE
jgi:hypothetical protein